MTREEAKDYIREWCPYDKHEEIINALEQKPILDKIKTEIEAYQSDAFYHDDVMMNKKMVLEIIDKYNAEGEDK